MSKTEMYTIDGETCFVRNLGDLDEKFFKMRENKPSCPLCHMDFEIGDNYTLAASGYKLFPNIGVHTRCFEGRASVVKVIDDYRDFKSISYLYRHWM